MILAFKTTFIYKSYWACRWIYSDGESSNFLNFNLILLLASLVGSVIFALNFSSLCEVLNLRGLLVRLSFIFLVLIFSCV